MTFHHSLAFAGQQILPAVTGYIGNRAAEFRRSGNFKLPGVGPKAGSSVHRQYGLLALFESS
jgi:hypothetical protein